MTGKEGRMTSEEGKEGFRCQVSGRKGIGQREKSMGQQVARDFVGVGGEEIEA